MSRGRHDQYSKAEVAIHGLACPFAKSDPDRYMSIEACKSEDGFKETRLLLEHMWRKHTRFFHCDFCHVRWSISKSRKEVMQKKEEHWENCEGKRRRVLLERPEEQDGSELLNWRQQELLGQTKSIRNVGAKLKALYEACEKPVPETYYTTAAPLAVQPQMPYGPPGEQSVRQDGGFLDGFGPTSEIPGPPRKRTTINNVSRATAVLQAVDSSEVSGASRSKDQDSGYASGPRNQGDTDDFPPPNGPPTQPGAFWSYVEGGNHVAMASPGHISTDEGSFTSTHDQVGRGHFRAYEQIDPALYDDVSSLTRGNDSLFDMNLPNSGAGSVGEPLDLSNITDLEAEFLEF